MNLRDPAVDVHDTFCAPMSHQQIEELEVMHRTQIVQVVKKEKV